MMEKISKRQGTGIPLRGNEIDTDRIIPARYMKSVTFSGLGAFAFYDERFDADKRQKQHPMNDSRFAGASVLIVNKNFGCGSSREHAPQALKDYGITAIIGESFAEIFAGNCTAMGIPVVCASAKDVQNLQVRIESTPGTEVSIDLKKMIVEVADMSYSISMPESYRKSLVDGSWDSTSLLLEATSDIDAVETTLDYRFERT